MLPVDLIFINKQMAPHFFQEEYIKLWAKTKFGFKFAYENYIDKVGYFQLTYNFMPCH